MISVIMNNSYPIYENSMEYNENFAYEQEPLPNNPFDDMSSQTIDLDGPPYETTFDTQETPSQLFQSSNQTNNISSI